MLRSLFLSRFNQLPITPSRVAKLKLHRMRTPSPLLSKPLQRWPQAEMNVYALQRVAEKRILYQEDKEISTFDQLAMVAPTGKNIMLKKRCLRSTHPLRTCPNATPGNAYKRQLTFAVEAEGDGISPSSVLKNTHFYFY